MTGAERIAAERERQVREEHWSAEHDDEHINGELAWAAVCYAAPQPVTVEHQGKQVDPWPWYPDHDKRCTSPTLNQRLDLLTKAGALIAAEIDRLQRKVDP